MILSNVQVEVEPEQTKKIQVVHFLQLFVLVSLFSLFTNQHFPFLILNIVQFTLTMAQLSWTESDRHGQKIKDFVSITHATAESAEEFLSVKKISTIYQ